MELTTVTQFRRAVWRLVGTDEDDPALVEHGEAVDDVIYEFLTLGCRNAQRYLLTQGYVGWRKRSSALSFSGSDSTDGGRYTALPSDFLRAYGHKQKSALVEPNGDRWGREIDPEDDNLQGNFYYLRNQNGTDQLWLARMAAPPTTLYLDYHYRHAAWSANVAIDFPEQVRSLIVAEAANVAKEDNWLPGGKDMEAKIERRLGRAHIEARDFARSTKSPRQFRAPYRAGNHW